MLPQRWISRTCSKNTLHPQRDCTLFLPQEVKKPNLWIHVIGTFLPSAARPVVKAKLRRRIYFERVKRRCVRESRRCHFCIINFHTCNQTRALTPDRARSQEMMAACDGSRLTESQGTDGAGICAASLLVRPRHRLPCYYLPLRSEVSEWEPPAGRQTHDDKHADARITEFAGAALLPRAGGQTHGWAPTVGTQSAKRHQKAVIRKISLWLVRWEVQRRMFVVSRAVTTDYMCGPALSGFWQELWPQAYLPTPETGLTTVTQT